MHTNDDIIRGIMAEGRHRVITTAWWWLRNRRANCLVIPAADGEVMVQEVRLISRLIMNREEGHHEQHRRNNLDGLPKKLHGNLRHRLIIRKLGTVRKKITHRL